MLYTIYMDKHKHLQTYFFFGLLVIACVLTFFIFRPYLYAIVFGITLAIVFSPLFKKIFDGGIKRRGIASLITIIIACIILLAPLSFFGFQVFKESAALYSYAVSGVGDSSLLQKTIEVKIFSSSFSLDLGEYSKQALEWIVENIGPLFSGISRFVVSFFISLFVMFFTLRDGNKFKEALFEYSPLSDSYDKEIYSKLGMTVNSVIKGTLLIAILQGILAGIGFFIFGLPNAALWGLITIIAALIPLVGTMLTMIPAAIYLLIVGLPLHAFGIVIWGVLVVSMIDNILRPKLISKGVDIHPIFIFLSVIGGIQFFGPIGFLLGPLVISLLFALLNIYPSLVSGTK